MVLNSSSIIIFRICTTCINSGFISKDCCRIALYHSNPILFYCNNMLITLLLCLVFKPAMNHLYCPHCLRTPLSPVHKVIWSTSVWSSSVAGNVVKLKIIRFIQYLINPYMTELLLYTFKNLCFNLLFRTYFIV